MKTEQDIEREVQARVNFKMEEILTGLRNRVALEYQLAVDMVDAPAQSQKHMHYNEAYKNFMQMVLKEYHLPTPSNDMYQVRLSRSKDRAVDKIMGRINESTRGKLGPNDTYSLTRAVVDAIELAQAAMIFAAGDSDIYEFKGKPYSIVCESKMKISELWIDVVIYKTEYNNPDGMYWVREKGQFYKLFSKKV